MCPPVPYGKVLSRTPPASAWEWCRRQAYALSSHEWKLERLEKLYEGLSEREQQLYEQLQPVAARVAEFGERFEFLGWLQERAARTARAEEGPSGVASVPGRAEEDEVVVAPS